MAFRALMLLAVLTELSPRASGLVTNPGFEDLGPDGKPVGWSFTGAAGVSGDARTGAVAVRVRNGMYSAEYAYQDVPAEQHHTYRVSCWVKRETEGSEAPRLRLYCYDSQEVLLDNHTHELFRDITTQYQQRATTIIAPPRTTRLRIRLDGMYYGDEWFLFDDVNVSDYTPANMPLWEDTPELTNRTVRTAHIADVYGFAVLPHTNPWYGRMNPFDGLLHTASFTNRAYYARQAPNPCTFNITLTGSPSVSWLSIHTDPLHRLKDVDLISIGDGAWDASKQPLLSIRSNNQGVILKELPSPLSSSRVRLDVFSTPGEYAGVNEIQFYSILNQPPAELPGQETHYLHPVPLSGFSYQAEIERCFANAEDQTVLDSQPSASGPLQLNAGHYTSLFGPQVGTESGCRGVRLTLSIAASDPNNILEICVKRGILFDRDYMTPSTRKLADVCRLYARVNGPVLDAAIQVPTFMLEPGERLWATLRPLGNLTLDLSTTRMAVLTCTHGEAEQEMAPYYLREAIRHFSRTQGTVTQEYVQRARLLNPNNREAQDMHTSLANTRPAVALTRPEWAPVDAPEWAVWACQAVRKNMNIVHWWIDNRQVANGELGGDFNDDAELTCQWPFLYLITHDMRLREALRRIADGVWDYEEETGYCIRMPDVEHAAEETLCTQPPMLLVDYGNPLYIDRLMRISSHIPNFWTGTDNTCGRRLFRSYYYMAMDVSRSSALKHDLDHAYNALVMAAPYYLTWYAGFTQPRGWFLEWADTWLDFTMGTACGKPAGRIPLDIHYSTCEIGHYTNCDWTQSPYYTFGDYCTRQAFIGAHLATEDARYLQPFAASYDNTIADPPGLTWRRVTADTRFDGSALARANSRIQCFNTPGCTNYSSYYQDSITLLYAWAATGNKSYLVEMLKEMNREQYRNEWLLTEPVAVTDRVSTPGRWALPYVFLGGNAGATKAGYPHLAVSYEGGGTDFSALVLANDATHVKLLIYNFADQERSVKVRFWELDPGTYEVTMGRDLNQDDVMDQETFRASPNPVLYRHQGVDFPLPAKQLQVINVQQVQAYGPPVQSRADLALSTDNVMVSPDHSTVTVGVQNLGAIDVPETQVRLLSIGSPELHLDTALAQDLQAPVNAQPQTPRTVTLNTFGTRGRLAVEVDPANLVMEVCETNNRIEFVVGDLPGDFDGDGDVDLDDFAVLQSCLGTVDPKGYCFATDLSQNHATGSEDLACFMMCLSGAGVPGSPGCLNP